MPDITKCPGEDCPLRDSCYRFTSSASEYQSYSRYDLTDLKNGECTYYWGRAEVSWGKSLSDLPKN
jgi:hypothetical protein